MTDDQLHREVARMARELADKDREIERLRAERDEARRSVCHFEHRYNIAYPKEDWMMTFGSPEQAAEYHGWDCFKEQP